MAEQTIFSAFDRVTHDGISVAVDGERVLLDSVVSGSHRLFVLCEPGAGLRLGQALVDAFKSEGQ